MTTKVEPAPKINRIAVSATVTIKLSKLKKPGRRVPITNTNPTNTSTGAKARICSPLLGFFNVVDGAGIFSNHVANEINLLWLISGRCIETRSYLTIAHHNYGVGKPDCFFQGVSGEDNGNSLLR